MAARFRCPECNHPLHHRHGDKPAKGCVLKCPECGARLVVPAALASLPQPQIDTPIPATADDGPEMPAGRPVVLPAMARSMPWLMSMCFHVALAMIFMFVAMIAIADPPDIPGHMPSFSYIDSNMPPINVSNPSPLPPSHRPHDPRKSQEDKDDKAKGQKKELEGRMAKDAIGAAPSLAGLNPDRKPLKLIGISGSGTFFGIEGLGGDGGDGGGGGGGGGTRRPDVVYLIDRSGSMVDTFDTVRREMLLSIGKMKPKRKFHVVLFSDGRPIEKTPRAMTPATERAKVKLVKFLEPVRASGKTDPIPAINRAFDALARGAAGKVAIIYLLTDGVFPDNDGVLKTIRRRNSGRLIQINTILYGNRPPVAEKVMARIAAENGGEYRFVSRDE